MKKRIISVLLIVGMFLTMLPLSVFAEEPENVVYVGTQPVSEEPLSFGNGTATYNPNSNTLTLENVTLGNNDAHQKSIADAKLEIASIYVESFSKGLNIELKGENEISLPESNDGRSYGIFGDHGPIRIFGNGSLNITVGDATEESCGIWTEGVISIEDGATVNVTVGSKEEKSGKSFGISGHIQVDILDGANVTVKSGNATDKSYGIYSLLKGIKIDAATVTATAGNSEQGMSAGICSDTSITMENGAHVTATGGETKAEENGSYGIFAKEDITISDAANIVAIGGKTEGNEASSAGISSDKNIMISNAKEITATGGEATEKNTDSFGIGVAGNQHIRINGSMVTATSGKAPNSIGINAVDSTVTIEKKYG